MEINERIEKDYERIDFIKSKLFKSKDEENIAFWRCMLRNYETLLEGERIYK